MNTYALIARFYEHIIDDVLSQLVLDKILEHTKPCKSLEIGCGTAYISRVLARKNYDVAAMDNTLEMLEIASNYAAYDHIEMTFLHHDMHAPFDYQADLIIMATDVINHAQSASHMKTIIDHVYNQLNPLGIFIVDVLNCEYLNSLVGHQETISLEEATIQWHVEKGDSPCSVVHHITMQEVVASHKQISVSLEDFNAMIASFELIDFLCLKERTIYVLKK